jgi:hypothetical protein
VKRTDEAFALTTNDGQIVSVERGGRSISLNEESQPFCDFLTWVSGQPDDTALQYSTVPSAEYFADCERLINRCKELGRMLTTYTSAGQRRRGFLAQDQHYAGLTFR